MAYAGVAAGCGFDKHLTPVTNASHLHAEMPGKCPCAMNGGVRTAVSFLTVWNRCLKSGTEMQWRMPCCTYGMASNPGNHEAGTQA